MRLLADENFPGSLVDSLRERGYDVLWARTHCAGDSDLQLLELAEDEGRILLTLDKDFWQISIQRKVPLRASGVVLFRMHPATPRCLEPLVAAFLAANRQWAGHVSVITLEGITMFKLIRQ